jgi:RIO kinase 1
VFGDDVYLDEYEQYEEIYDPHAAGAAMRSRRKANHKPKKSRDEVLSALTDDLTDVELGFETTYTPSKYESGWLLQSLYSFYDEGLISDVLALVKGGKEASVYVCRAHPATGYDLLAAKVYRPRMFRNLRNDAMYRQGREILVAGGKPAGRDAGYIERAMRHKTAFGVQAGHTSWLMHEFNAMEQLHAGGGDVPRPIHAADNAILMTYHGELGRPAPTLNSVSLDVEEADRLLRRLLHNVHMLLRRDLVHGDLSAYNILYWAPNGAPGEMTIIDFPQVVNLRGNPKARFVLERDVERVCDYFREQGLRPNARAITDRLWRRYMGEMDPEDLAADLSRVELALASAGD